MADYDASNSTLPGPPGLSSGRNPRGIFVRGSSTVVDSAQSTMATRREEILAVIKDVLAPLVAADGGRLYVVRAEEHNIALHLDGRFAGCPGNEVTTRRVLRPAIEAVAPGAQLTVTWGRLVPDGAVRIDPPSVDSTG
jgi:Fe-S cluster biogenesis protein NfuA